MIVRSHAVARGSDDRFAELLQRLGAAAGTDRVERFEPHGVSWVRVAVDRTVVLHSWPEHGLVTVDVYAGSAVALSPALVALGFEPLR